MTRAQDADLTLRFRLAAGAHRAAAGVAARCRAAAGGAAGRSAGDRRPAVRDLPDLLRAGRRAGGQRHQGHSGAACRPPHRARRGAEDRGDLAQAARRLALARLRASRPSVCNGRHVRFGDEGKVCFLGQLDATVEDKGEGGEVTLAFAFHGAGARPGDRRARRDAAAALYRRATRRPTSGTAPITRPCSRDEEGSVAAPTAGLHFTPSADRAAAGARRHAAQA